MSQTIPNINTELDTNPSELPLPSQEVTEIPAILESGPCLGSPKVTASLASCASLPCDQQLDNLLEAHC